MYLKPRKKNHEKFNISNDREIKSTRNLIQFRYHKNNRGKRMCIKESWYKSNFILVGSNFNSPCYKTRAEKCLVNSNFNSKGRFLDFFAKWRKKEKFKFYSRSCIPDPLNWSFINFEKYLLGILFNDLKIT